MTIMCETVDARLERLEREKNAAYWERNQMVAFLSWCYPSSLERDNEITEDGWGWVVIVDGPEGQMSWHIHDSELSMFTHLHRQVGRSWDGHSTDEKYSRLRTCRPKVVLAHTHDTTGANWNWRDRTTP